MTKLLEWLTAFTVLVSIWFYLICSQNNLVKENYILIFYSPVIFVVLFGLYALTTVLYRVYTFNDCKDAAISLQEEIIEAREYLSKQGFKFKENSK